MSDKVLKATELYNRFGFQKASFIAFDKMQNSNGDNEVEFWLAVINHIALLDMGDDLPVYTVAETS